MTAKVGKKSYKCKVTVKNPPIAISAKKQTVAVSKSFDLSIKNATAGVKWSTSNKKVATIKKVSKYKYRVTGKKVGTATITAKVRGKKYTCKVTVKPLATKLAVSGANSVLVGSTLQLKAVVSPRGSGGVIRWSSSNPKVATVSSSGLVRGISEGMVKITAVTSDGSKKGGSVMVTVKAAPKPVTPGETRPEAPVKPSTPETEPPKPVNPNPPQTEAPGSGEVTEKPNDKPVTPPQTEAPTEKPIETEKPDIPPQTDAPVESEKPDVPPQTEAPYIEVVGGENYEVEVGNTVNITVRSNRSNVSYMLANGNGNIVSASMVGNTLTVKGEKAGTETILFSLADADADTIVRVKVTPRGTSNTKLKLVNGYNDVTIRGGDLSDIEFISTLNESSISFDCDCINDELILGNFDKLSSTQYKISIMGRVAGVYHVTISGGGESVVSTVTVTSTDTEWFKYDEWIKGLLVSLGCSEDNPVESFKKLGAWLVDNRGYALQGDYKYLYRTDGDCEAFTGLFVDVASRYFGLKAYSSNTGAGHTKAIVEISDVKWFFDAGTNGTAGNRSFTAVPQDSSIPAYRYYRGVWSETM